MTPICITFSLVFIVVVLVILEIDNVLYNERKLESEEFTGEFGKDTVHPNEQLDEFNRGLKAHKKEKEEM